MQSERAMIFGSVPKLPMKYMVRLMPPGTVMPDEWNHFICQYADELAGLMAFCRWFSTWMISWLMAYPVVLIFLPPGSQIDEPDY